MPDTTAAATPKPSVYLAMPRGSPSVIYNAVAGMFLCTDGRNNVTLGEHYEGASWERNHNTAWYDALNRRDAGEITHFAMIHADVCPTKYWLDVLMSELERTQTAMISTAIPFRDDSGLTSVAIDNMEDHFAPRRLTLKEIRKLPPTFTYDDCFQRLVEIEPNSRLVLNTGLMLLDIRKDRWGDWADEVNFQFVHERVRAPGEVRFADGTKKAVNLRVMRMRSEDWELSRVMNDKKVPYVGTSAVVAKHVGYCVWGNDEDYGAERDEAHLMLKNSQRRDKELTEAFRKGQDAMRLELTQHERVGHGDVMR